VRAQRSGGGIAGAGTPALCVKVPEPVTGIHGHAVQASVGIIPVTRRHLEWIPSRVVGRDHRGICIGVILPSVSHS